MKVAVTIAAVAVIALIFCVLRLNKPQPTQPTMNPSPTDSQRNTHFVFAKILDTVLPIERGEKYEDPLDAMLHEQHIGEVTGGGTMQKDKTIEYVGVDIELVNLDSALDATRTKLRELGAPKGSVLEFKRDGQDTSVPIHDN